ncbi:MAG: hypothetical protein M1823_001220 [Watsoniomyces obsoletus]|nr:MAG: hypothetical protein M1823_001220 [Watsoniomyces obsoletus]
MWPVVFLQLPLLALAVTSYVGTLESRVVVPCDVPTARSSPARLDDEGGRLTLTIDGVSEFRIVMAVDVATSDAPAMVVKKNQEVRFEGTSLAWLARGGRRPSNRACTGLKYLNSTRALASVTASLGATEGSLSLTGQMVAGASGGNLTYDLFFRGRGRKEIRSTNVESGMGSGGSNSSVVSKNMTAPTTQRSSDAVVVAPVTSIGSAGVESPTAGPREAWMQYLSSMRASSVPMAGIATSQPAASPTISPSLVAAPLSEAVQPPPSTLITQILPSDSNRPRETILPTTTSSSQSQPPQSSIPPTSTTTSSQSTMTTITRSSSTDITSTSTAPSTTITSTPTPKAAVSPSAPPPSSNTYTNKPNEENNNSNVSAGAIAGIAIGSTAGISLLALAFIFLYRRRHQQQQQQNHPSHHSHPSSSSDDHSSHKRQHSSQFLLHKSHRFPSPIKILHQHSPSNLSTSSSNYDDEESRQSRYTVTQSPSTMYFAHENSMPSPTSRLGYLSTGGYSSAGGYLSTGAPSSSVRRDPSPFVDKLGNACPLNRESGSHLHEDLNLREAMMWRDGGGENMI